MVAIISQGICISKYHTEYLKYKQFLFVNHTSLKVGKNIKHHHSRFLDQPLDLVI